MCSETCPNGFKLLSNQASSANCYSYFGHDMNWPWVIARDNCATTAGAYLWRPNTEQEANAVKNEFNIPYGKPIWTGANDIDKDGKYTFAVENSPFSFHQRPFGADGFSSNANSKCVMIQFAWERGGGGIRIVSLHVAIYAVFTSKYTALLSL
ncbi:unnamed protein product [Mytilus edulis]|uniref:C-type lectin domain-containing protein n=1 Tax=Mytilus edulis TaxID=6550 RepID=A0A8S3RUY2_MYTED|nr:unnamed protein product [Mytilus edulis]